MNDNKNAGMALVGLVLLFVGGCVGWFVKPPPTVEIRPILKPPFVEVIVDGKVYDARHLKLVPEPEKKKGWFGDGKPAAMNMGCDCTDCPADCGCGCNAIMLTTMLTKGDDKTFTTIMNDPKFLGGLANVIARLEAFFGYVDQNADSWKREAALRAEWTAAQVTWGLMLLGGIFGALVVNGFLVYGCLNTLSKR